MLDWIVYKTQYIVCVRKNGTSNGLIGNSVNAEAVPATVSATTVQRSTV